jgi:hypothetical protein
MTLLSIDEPVFIIDLTEATMAEARTDFEDPAPEAGGSPRALPSIAEPIRSVALVFDGQVDPVLLGVESTEDAVMLDALARLLRSALITGRSLASLAVDHGDELLRRLYFQRSLPRFVYDGIPSTVRHRVPEALVRAMGKGGRSRRKNHT